MPPLEYCGTDYRFPPRWRAVLLNELEKNKTARRPKNGDLQTELAAEAYVPFGDRAVPYARLRASGVRGCGPSDWPATSTGLYMELVTFRYFKSLGSLALATALTIIGLYFLGRFVTARMGQWLLSRFELLVLARCRSSAASIRR